MVDKKPEPADLDACDSYFGALTTAAVLDLPIARQMAFARAPLTNAMADRTRAAVSQALR